MTRIYTPADVATATGASRALVSYRLRAGHLPTPAYRVGPHGWPGWTPAQFARIVEDWAALPMGPRAKGAH